MKSVKFDGNVSADELDGNPAEGCANMCGICPRCVLGPAPPGSTPCPWKVSDGFKRSFVMDLILQCRSSPVLESIQRALEFTSWSLFTYGRARRPDTPLGPRALEGEPAGVDMSEIWEWFNSSNDRIKLRYLYRIFSLCDLELLRMVANLTSVLLVRQKQGFLQSNVSGHNSHQEQGSDEDSGEDPALMVVPGSSESVSGVSRYKDFISCLPVDLSKRILGLLDKHSLRSCHKVSQHWQLLAQETKEEIRFRRHFQDETEAMMKSCQSIYMIKPSPTYANMAEVPVPVKDNKKVDIQPSVQKVKPFEAAYAKIKTEMVQMEERNVYCGAYSTTVLLNKEDSRRVLEYRGGLFMATASKDRVRLLSAASKPKELLEIKVPVGFIRVVLLLEDRHLLITAGSDPRIRCWSLKTDTCAMELCGHIGVINCLDVHADRLVSGGGDCFVKVWSLDTGKQFEDFHFKHRSPVECVKIGTSTACSGCDQGLVKVWDLENAALLRVIDAHRSSVMCLFFDKWHLLSGYASGQVMAWSINCEAKECLMTFNHPKKVKCLTLVYLRVITGCVDGKIRIFNFLTGDCLREITVSDAETGRILSLHIFDDSILVNGWYSVKRYQFAEVFWDYLKEGSHGGENVTRAPIDAD